MAVRTMAHRFGLDGCELKLRWVTFAAAGPHARPLTFAFRWLFLTAFAARIVNTCTERDRKVKMRTATASAASAGVGAFKAATAVTTAAAFTWFTPATTTTTFFLDCSCK